MWFYQLLAFTVRWTKRVPRHKITWGTDEATQPTDLSNIIMGSDVFSEAETSFFSDNVTQVKSKCNASVVE